MSRLYQQVLIVLLSFAFILCINVASAQSSSSSASANAMQQAMNALLVAEAEYAPTLASNSYMTAQDAYNQAQLFDSKRKRKDALRMAEKSIRYAQLATIEARYYRLKIQVENKVTENADLRRSLLLGSSEVTQ
jgi:hypothetical protein